MKTEPAAQKRRVRRRYSAADRERLIRELARSRLSKKAFWRKRRISEATFYTWLKKHGNAQLALPVCFS